MHNMEKHCINYIHDTELHINSHYAHSIHSRHAHTPPTNQAVLISFLLRAASLTLLPTWHSLCTSACCMKDSSSLLPQGP